MMRTWLTIIILITFLGIDAQTVAPLSISLEEYKYPYPVSFFNTRVEGQDLQMAYMDIKPSKNDNGKTVVLMHGKNFGSFYWENVIKWLSQNGYRVVAIDQLGFGKSSKAEISYSFNLLAANTHALLASLNIKEIILMGHSTGGMLATRYALTYPQQVSKLVLEDPIGLEDYRLLVPYDSITDLYKEEFNKPDEATTKYIKAYFFAWKPEYSIYADIMNGWKRSAEYNRAAKVAALTTMMIYEQPVCYEFKNIKCPTLIVVGKQDRTVIEKNKVPQNLLSGAGQFTVLAEKAASQIAKGAYQIIDNCGHIPHIEQLDKFEETVSGFLERP